MPCRRRSIHLSISSLVSSAVSGCVNSGGLLVSSGDPLPPPAIDSSPFAQPRSVDRGVGNLRTPLWPRAQLRDRPFDRFLRLGCCNYFGVSVFRRVSSISGVSDVATSACCSKAPLRVIVDRLFEGRRIYCCDRFPVMRWIHGHQKKTLASDDNTRTANTLVATEVLRTRSRIPLPCPPLRPTADARRPRHVARVPATLCVESGPTNPGPSRPGLPDAWRSCARAAPW